jgi:hypothetical protein
MTNLTETQIEILKNEIYETLMAGYDNEGNEMGMGEMGECLDTADTIINDWVTKAGITIIENNNN